MRVLIYNRGWVLFFFARNRTTLHGITRLCTFTHPLSLTLTRKSENSHPISSIGTWKGYKCRQMSSYVVGKSGCYLIFAKTSIRDFFGRISHQKSSQVIIGHYEFLWFLTFATKQESSRNCTKKAHIIRQDMQDSPRSIPFILGIRSSQTNMGL